MKHILLENWKFFYPAGPAVLGSGTPQSDSLENPHLFSAIVHAFCQSFRCVESARYHPHGITQPLPPKQNLPNRHSRRCPRGVTWYHVVSRGVVPLRTIHIGPTGPSPMAASEPTNQPTTWVCVDLAGNQISTSSRQTWQRCMSSTRSGGQHAYFVCRSPLMLRIGFYFVFFVVRVDSCFVCCPARPSW
jgi:hypothetical protein